MKILTTTKEIEAFLRILTSRTTGDSGETEQSVKRILDDVRKYGDKAVLHYTRKFDCTGTKCLAVSPEEISASADRADKRVVQALRIAAARIKAFHGRQRERSWSFSEGGALLGQIIRPIDRVGVYVPGGKASYPSSVLMNVIPAQVAGVKEVVLCVPAPQGDLNPSVMAAVRLLKVKEVYRIGGAQAVAAMAYGTRTIKKVDKIVGPGNIYVATAKKMVFGIVDIDMIAGPSEILVIADDSANPVFAAADLLSQAEHDELASSVLIAHSRQFADQVLGELQAQLDALQRKDIARKSLEKYGAIMVTRDLRAAADIANRIAPEHLEIMIRNPKSMLPFIRNAGAIFLGRWTPEALGDYAAGPNHTLPTGCTSRFFSPLGVYDFVKRSSVLSFSKQGFIHLAETVKILADAEGLGAHGNTIRLREKGERR